MTFSTRDLTSLSSVQESSDLHSSMANIAQVKPERIQELSSFHVDEMSFVSPLDSNLNVMKNKNYTPDDSINMSGYEFQRVIQQLENFLNIRKSQTLITSLQTPPMESRDISTGFIRTSYNQPDSQLNQSIRHSSLDNYQNHSLSLALEIYNDLIHIRDHSLYHDYTRHAPRLLRLPIVSFLAAMSANQHSEHPIRNSAIDIGVEYAALTVLGSSIGSSPAGIIMLASHLAESGLDRFPSWEQIGKMKKNTPHERYAFSRMIEARATAELLAWPSKATHIISNYIKFGMNLWPEKPSKNESTSGGLLPAYQALQNQGNSSTLSFSDVGKQSPWNSMQLQPQEKSSTFIFQTLPDFSSYKDKPKLFGLSTDTESKKHWDKMYPHDSEIFSKSTRSGFTFFSLDKLSSSNLQVGVPAKDSISQLSSSPRFQPRSDKIGNFIAQSKLPKFEPLSLPTKAGFSDSKFCQTAWDKTKSQRDEQFAPTNKFLGCYPSETLSLESTSLSWWRKPSPSSGLKLDSSTPPTATSITPFFSSQSKMGLNASLVSQQFPNAWDRIREQGMKNFGKK